MKMHCNLSPLFQQLQLQASKLLQKTETENSVIHLKIIPDINTYVCVRRGTYPSKRPLHSV